MDIRMPLLDGIHATRQLLAGPVVRVLIVTTFNLDAYVFDALRAGATGFLSRTRRPLCWGRDPVGRPGGTP